MRTSVNETAGLKRDLQSNTNFINNHRSTIENFNLDDITTRLAEIERKILNLPRNATEVRSTAPQGPTGTIKVPILASLEPSDYRAFRDMYKAHAKVHNWSDEVAKQQLLLSVSPKNLLNAQKRSY